MKLLLSAVLSSSLLIIMGGITGCAGKNPDVASWVENDSVLFAKADITQRAETWADSVCRKLSLAQKVGQMFMPALYASVDCYNIAQLQEYADSCIGSVLLLKGDSAGAAEVAERFFAMSDVVPFVAIDAEWGLGMRLADAPKFPENSQIAEDASDQTMYDYGREVARECRLLHINMVLGPVVDIASPNSYMRKRSLGAEPHRVTDLSLAYARGLEDGNVISVAKHFPGHGAISSDSHKSTGVLNRDIPQLDSIDLIPFKAWSAQHLSGIMVGHIMVPSIDSNLLPATVSKKIITDLLRNEIGYGGLVLTDAMNMGGAGGYSAADAIAAGADIVVAPLNTFSQIQEVVKSVKQGRISMSDIDAHVKRILFYKYLLIFGCDAGITNLIHAEKSLLRSPQVDSISHSLLFPTK